MNLNLKCCTYTHSRTIFFKNFVRHKNKTAIKSNCLDTQKDDCAMQNFLCAVIEHR